MMIGGKFWKLFCERYFSNCLHTENDMKNVKDLLHKRQLTLEKVHFAT